MPKQVLKGSIQIRVGFVCHSLRVHSLLWHNMPKGTDDLSHRRVAKVLVTKLQKNVCGCTCVFPCFPYNFPTYDSSCQYLGCYTSPQFAVVFSD